jgi:hypothetical protein
VQGVCRSWGGGGFRGRSKVAADRWWAGDGGEQGTTEAGLAAGGEAGRRWSRWWSGGEGPR